MRGFAAVWCFLRWRVQEVTKAQGEELAKKYGMKFIETSAKTGTGVEGVRPPPVHAWNCAPVVLCGGWTPISSVVLTSLVFSAGVHDDRHRCHEATHAKRTVRRPEPGREADPNQVTEEGLLLACVRWQAFCRCRAPE